MALNTTVVNGTQAGPFVYNDYLNLLTGVMNDQPVYLKYAPASSGAVPTLKLGTNGNAPLLLGLNSSGAQAFEVDASGNIFFGAAVSTSFAELFFNSTLHVAQLSTPQAGATALGVSVGTWDGAASHVAFSFGGQFNGAAAWVDNAGNLTLTGGVITGKGGASITIGNATSDVVLSPASGHWTYLNNNNGSAYVDQNGTIHGVALYDSGSRAAIQGAHSAGQTIVSYGTGQPASLNANEVFFQVA